MVRKKDKTKNTFPPSFFSGSISSCWYFTLNSFFPDFSISSLWVVCEGWGMEIAVSLQYFAPAALPSLHFFPCSSMGFLMKVTAFHKLLLPRDSSSSVSAPVWALSMERRPPEGHCYRRALPWAAALSASASALCPYSLHLPPVYLPLHDLGWISAPLWTHRSTAAAQGTREGPFLQVIDCICW